MTMVELITLCHTDFLRKPREAASDITYLTTVGKASILNNVNEYQAADNDNLDISANTFI